jgi:hypothetical protein
MSLIATESISLGSTFKLQIMLFCDVQYLVVGMKMGMFDSLPRNWSCQLYTTKLELFFSFPWLQEGGTQVYSHSKNPLQFFN